MTDRGIRRSLTRSITDNSAILMRDLTRPAMGIYLCEVISTLQAAGHFIKSMTSQPKPRTVRSQLDIGIVGSVNTRELSLCFLGLRGPRKNTRRGICTGILTCLGRGPCGFLFSLLGFVSGILLLVHASVVARRIAAHVSPARGLLPTRRTAPAPTVMRRPSRGVRPCIRSRGVRPSACPF